MASIKREWLWAIPVVLVLIFNFWNPVGYGGASGSDDDRYLTAALCWLQNGPCLPTNHWEGRWPVIAPLSVSLSIFGVNRFGLALPFALASMGCLWLLKKIGDDLFARPVGLAAACILGVLPAFAIQTYSATVEPLELLFLLGCIALILKERLILAGLSLGLAMQTRETAVAALVPLLFLLGKDWRRLALFLAAFMTPLLAEFVIYYVITGDPMYRRSLSMRHIQIASTELLTEERGPPFFNKNLISNWNYEPGVRVFWLLDGFLNLFINLKSGLLFWLAPLLLYFYRKRLSDRERQVAYAVLAASFFYAAVLIYGLSIDPKPRMMYVPLAGLSLVFGLVAVRAWNLVIGTVVIVILPILWVTLAAQPRHKYWEDAAEGMLQRHPGQIESSQAGYFAIHPVLSQLPTTGSGKPYLMFVRNQPCGKPSNMDPFDLSGLTLVEEKKGNPYALAFDYEWSLCLFRYPPNFRPPVLPRAREQLPSLRPDLVSSTPRPNDRP